MIANTWTTALRCESGACVEVQWRTASLSNGTCVEVGTRCEGASCVEVGVGCEGGDCVQVGGCGCDDGTILVRDSKLGDDSPVLSFDRKEWAAFCGGVRNGEFEFELTP